MNHQGLMTIDDAAKVLGVKKSWIRSAIFKKSIPYVKLGNLVRFREKDLKEWIQKNTVEARS